MKLTREQARARFAAVALIEISAFAVCFAPLLWDASTLSWPFGIPDGGWKQDCARIGLVSMLVVLTLCVLTQGGLTLLRRRTQPVQSASELAIAIIYLLNLVALTLAIARTQGPAISLYGPLLPVQLSAMLLLELQKEAATEETSKMSYFYTATAILAWMSVYFNQQRLSKIVTYSPDPPGKSLVTEQEAWTVLLTAVGMALAFLSFLLPKSETFSEFLGQFRQES